jgi:pilus assembly protein FimV
MVIKKGGAVGKPVSRSVVLASAMLALSSAAGAAGLGRLNVLSDLGQPLRAEIDVVAVEKGELETLSARLASIETYVQNNLPYPTPSMGLQLSLELRQSGQPYIVAVTAQPINEPFVDILVELTWNGGRILRGYTALIDPPTFANDDGEASVAQPSVAPEIAPAPLAAPEPQVTTQFGSELTEPAPVAAEPVAESVAEPGVGVADEPTAESSAEVPAEPAPAVDAVASDEGQPATDATEAGPASAADESAADRYAVKRGDTLSKIAREFVSEDVSLDQMLVLLTRANPEAFVDGNMNRLKAGKVLQVPGGADAAAIDPAEARKIVRMQTADFNAYREKLAAAAGDVAVEPALGQSASGSVSPMVSDAAPAGVEQSKEVVKLSGGESAAAAGSQSGTRALEEELAARDKTIREQNDRVAMLEKQVKDMQSLLEIKNKGMADVEQSAALPPVAAAPAPAPAATEVAPTAEAPPAQEAPNAEKPVKAKKPKVVAQPAPSLTDTLLDQPLYLAGGAAVLGLLGFIGFKVARKRKAGAAPESAEAADQPLDQPGAAEARAEASTGLPSTGVPPMSEDVDPLAEAEIYLAYGRDGQAEEILKEALQSNPRRHEIHLKLLEIYSKRKDVAAFDGVARELHMATGGQGDTWLQAARMGYALDPQNPRYALGKPTGAAAIAAAAAASAAAMDDKLDFDIGLDDTDAATKTDIDLTRLGAAAGTSTDVDLSNLSAGQDEMSKLAQSTGASMAQTQQRQPMDLDLSADQGKAAGLDFDFDLNGLGAEAPQQDNTRTVTNALSQTMSGDASSSVQFDLSKISLDEGALDKVEPRLDVGTSSTPDIDLSSIDLDLSGGKTEGSVDGGARDDRWYDVQTKFDLAKAYQEMGDKEGAREILREVIAEGDNEQQAAAQRVLEALA